MSSILFEPTFFTLTAHEGQVVSDLFGEQVFGDHVEKINGLHIDATLLAYEEHQVDLVVYQSESLCK